MLPKNGIMLPKKLLNVTKKRSNVTEKVTKCYRKSCKIVTENPNGVNRKSVEQSLHITYILTYILT